ncbi:MAG: penicillin-binding protein 2 [Chloroflexia bacterium]|nr:penicillin-binding protein 2 [Chloroflexia bacterium]
MAYPKQETTWRIILVQIVLASAFSLLAFRLWNLQIVQGAHFNQAAETNRLRTLPTLPFRGNIYDRNGIVLAENVPSFSVQVMVESLPSQQAERDRLLDQLCDLLSCPGWLEIAPQAIDPQLGRQLYPLLSEQLQQPYLKLAQDLYTATQSISVTVYLSGQEGQWLRGLISPTNGISYVNSLELALQENAAPPYMPVTLMDQVPREYALVLEEQRLEFPGIFVQIESSRRYPSGTLTSHIVGYIGRINSEELELYNPNPRSGQATRYLENDRIGKVGAEKAFEELLRGQLGIREIQVDASGHPVGPPRQIQQAQPGYDVVLTLDSDLQAQTTEILAQWIQEADRQKLSYYRPIYSGVAIAMDPRNGQILAMVSLPSYDNNAFAQGITVSAFRELLEDPQHPLVNRTISGEYPPGSTFKLLIASAGLQEGVITPESRIYDGGALVVPNRYDESLPPQVFPCWLPGGHGWQNVVTAIQNSCNVFFFTVAGGTHENKFEDALGIDRLERYAHAFGYAEPTGLELPAEAYGLFPNPAWKQEVLGEPWVQGDLYNMGIGQGNILVSPLQNLNAMAAIANGGTLYQPQLLLRALDQQGQIVQEFSPIVRRELPVAAENLALVREGMRRVVLYSGTDYGRTQTEIAIAGKTGSAEYGPYLWKNNRQAHAWFVGFAPYEEPQLAVVVMIEGGGAASRLAMPAVVDIIDYYFTRPQGPVDEGGYGATDSNQR